MAGIDRVGGKTSIANATTYKFTTGHLGPDPKARMALACACFGSRFTVK